MKYLLLSKLIEIATTQCNDIKADLVSAGFHPQYTTTAVIVCHSGSGRYSIFHKTGLYDDINGVKIKGRR